MALRFVICYLSARLYSASRPGILSGRKSRRLGDNEGRSPTSPVSADPIVASGLLTEACQGFGNPVYDPRGEGPNPGALAPPTISSDPSGTGEVHLHLAGVSVSRWEVMRALLVDPKFLLGLLAVGMFLGGLISHLVASAQGTSEPLVVALLGLVGISLVIVLIIYKVWEWFQPTLRHQRLGTGETESDPSV